MAGIPSKGGSPIQANLQGGAAAPSGVSRSGDVKFGDVIIGSNKWATIALAGIAIWFILKRAKKLA